MRTLELECPTCQEVLELDAGFAGGVCRCSSCGTLMTVPKDAGQAETLSKPAQEPDYDYDDGDDYGAVKPDSSRRPSDRSGAAAIEPGEYRTASGKVIKLDSSVKVPMAQGKKKKVQAATAIVFFGIVLAGVIAGVLVIIMITSGGKGPGGTGGGDVVVQYDAAANPYELKFANLAGLPVQGSVTAVIEASGESYDWMLDFGDMVGVGLSQPAEEASIGFIAASAADASVASIDSTAVAELSADKLSKWFAELPEDGEADWPAAIQAAIDTAPDTLILVVGDIGPEQVESWSKLISGQQRLTIHVVAIDGSAGESILREWLSERGSGYLVTFESGNFEYLKDAAEE